MYKIENLGHPIIMLGGGIRSNLCFKSVSPLKILAAGRRTWSALVIYVNLWFLPPWTCAVVLLAVVAAAVAAGCIAAAAATEAAAAASEAVAAGTALPLAGTFAVAVCIRLSTVAAAAGTVADIAAAAGVAGQRSSRSLTPGAPFGAAAVGGPAGAAACTVAAAVGDD